MVLKPNILITLSALPYPPRLNGLTLRYYPLLEYLARYYVVDLAILEPSVSSDTARHSPISELTNEIFYHQYNNDSVAHQDQSWVSKSFKTLEKIISLKPLFSIKPHRSQIVAWWKNNIKSDHYQCILITSAEDYAFIRENKLIPDKLPTLVDITDSPYLLQKNALLSKRYVKGNLPLQIIEVIKTRFWERRIARKTHQTIYISDRDRLACNRPADTSNISVIPNFVLAEDYSAGRIELESGWNIGFLGNFAYKPNEEAVLWIFEEILPNLIKNIPDLKFYVIGRNPTTKIKKYQKHPHIRITGEVENHWLWLNSMDLMLQPIFSGAGLQNKIIESMYAGKPVLTNHLGNGGINAKPGHSIELFKTAQECLDLIITMRNNDARRSKMASNGKEHVEKRFSKEKVLEKWRLLFDQCICA
ncbi:MAG: glycosyltransferase family 4 protein [Immundisolibacteraceae bacterium]|nr:glycosyltransferase family 4 protein [Immundisolibacteraceae bacterium]